MAGGDDVANDEISFVVRGESTTAKLQRSMLTNEVCPVLLALVADRADASMPQGDRDSQGRYILDGPSNPHAFFFLMECVRKGGEMTFTEMSDRLPDVFSRMEACRHVDYFMLPGANKALLTKLLLQSLVIESMGEAIDASRMGLCRSDMIMDKIHLEGVYLRRLHIENSHVQNVVIRRCHIAECEFALSVTACEVHISKSKLEGVNTSMFAAMITIEDGSDIQCCNIRVVEELHVRDSQLHKCTFQGCDEDRKDRQVVSATFTNAQIHGDIPLPFDKIVCERTYFHGGRLHMTIGGASITLSKSRIMSLPAIDSDTHVNLCLDDCQVLEQFRFDRMKLHFKNVRFSKPCEFVDVLFPERVCDVTFPRTCRFVQARFLAGLHACIASGCVFEGCNLGHGQDALSGCLLTHCSFRSCRFPFLEADSPVANLSYCDFVGCRIQGGGQFPHEESFIIKSYWLRKWNLAGATVSEAAELA